MPALRLEVKARNRRDIKLPSPCRHNSMICVINCCQNVSCQELTDVKKPFLSYDDPDLCNDYILKDWNYIDCFCINFLCHCVLGKVPLGTNLLDNVFFGRKLYDQPRNQEV